MDPQQLFGAAKNVAPAKAEHSKILVIPDSLRTLPLVWGIRSSQVEHNYKVVQDTPAGCARQLLAAWAFLGLVSTLDYAEARGEWKMLPDICLSGAGPTMDFILFFNRDLKKLKTIAVEKQAYFARALLKILLRERYETEAELIPMPADLPDMLKKADAALLSGEKALEYQSLYKAHLDLGEDWFDMTGLPLVSNVWAGYEADISGSDMQILQDSLATGLQNIDAISKEYAARNPLSWRLYRDYFLKNRSYHLGPEEKEGLKEFYRYAFYHGLIEHIPDLHFWGG